mgnify:CR=1 FL=1
MGSVAFTNAKIFFAGYDISAQFNQIALAYDAESLDETTFGNSTRTRKGGLKTSRASGGGFWEAGANKIDPILFESLALEDAVVMVFAEGVTEGSTSTGSGHMFKSTLARYNLGGAVGDLLPFTLEAEGRGAGA